MITFQQETTAFTLHFNTLDFNPAIALSLESTDPRAAAAFAGVAAATACNALAAITAALLTVTAARACTVATRTATVWRLELRQDQGDPKSHNIGLTMKMMMTSSAGAVLITFTEL